MKNPEHTELSIMQEINSVWGQTGYEESLFFCQTIVQDYLLCF
jgi:hypothetical protein